MMWTESSLAFSESYTADDAQVMADNGETKVLITPPPRSVSTQYDSDHEGVVRIFVALSCKLWGYLFI